MITETTLPTHESRPAAWRRPVRGTPRFREPVLVTVIAGVALAACIGGQGPLGYSIAGWSWVIVFVLALYTLIFRPRRITFPISIWLPWALFVLARLLTSDIQAALQRTVMLLCPILVGVAVSTRPTNAKDLQFLSGAARVAAVCLWIIIALKEGLSLTGLLPARLNIAPDVMTGNLLATIFATEFALGRKRALSWWLYIRA